MVSSALNAGNKDVYRQPSKARSSSRTAREVGVGGSRCTLEMFALLVGLGEAPLKDLEPVVA